MRKDIEETLRKAMKEINGEPDFIIHIECRKKQHKSQIKVEGTKHDLMNGLALLAESLKNESNLSEKDIRFAIDLGLKGREELQNELMKQLDQFKKHIEELIKD